MSHRSLLSLIVLALAAPAAAQVRDHRDKPQPRPGPGGEDVAIRTTVSDWGPRTARPGTTITIDGSGFGKTMTLTVGGRELPATITFKRVSFTAPADGGDGVIRLRSNKSGTETEVGRLVIELPTPPAISGFSPEGGPAGSVVRLNGRGFAPRDKISYGRIPVSVVGRGEGWVDVKVPAAARRPERFSIRGEYGETQTAREYALELPMRITDFQPRSGAVGSEVSVRGEGFRPGDVATLGGKRADVVRVAERELVLQVPPGTPGGEITVRRRDVELRARGGFDVLTPPTLVGFTPSKGEPGIRVTLTGTYLADAEVWFGGVRLRADRGGDSELEITLPRDARSARFRVKTRGGEATSTREFEVLSYGDITDARPRRVAAGGTTILYGSGLDGVQRIAIGDRDVRIRGPRDRGLEIELPADARDGRITWWSHGRKAETTWTITVLRPPSISSFQPDVGPVGTAVIVRGDDLDGTTRLFFGDKPMKIIDRKPGTLVGEIPRGASGRDHLWVEGDGARVRSSSSFTVRAVPIVRIVRPSHGEPGTRVVVRGEGFDDGTEILIGTWRSTVIKRRGDELEIEVPRNARPGDHEVSARSGPQTTIAPVRFTVDGPPPPPLRIVGFSPREVEVGGKVELEGTGFSTRTQVIIGGRAIKATRIADDGTRMWVELHPKLRGEHAIEVLDGRVRTRSSDKLVIGLPPRGPNVRDHRDKPPTSSPDVRDHRDKDKKKPAY